MVPLKSKCAKEVLRFINYCKWWSVEIITCTRATVLHLHLELWIYGNDRTGNTFSLLGNPFPSNNKAWVKQSLDGTSLCTATKECSEMLLLSARQLQAAVVKVSPNLLVVLLNCISPSWTYDNNVTVVLRCFAPPNGDCHNHYDDDDRRASKSCTTGKWERTTAQETVNECDTHFNYDYDTFPAMRTHCWQTSSTTLMTRPH